VERVEDFVEGKMPKTPNVNLRAEHVDLGKKFDILSASREHSQERGRTSRRPAHEERRFSQGCAKVEIQRSHERRARSEARMEEGERSAEQGRGRSSAREEDRRSRDRYQEEQTSPGRENARERRRPESMTRNHLGGELSQS
jgi:hypothetical protein